MRVRMTKPTKGTRGRVVPAGKEVEGRSAYVLCSLGLAEPVDDEAKKKVAKLAKVKAKRREARLKQLRKQVDNARRPAENTSNHLS